MKKKLYTEILEELSNRKTWENKCLRAYKMRHEGVTRRSKPWKDASEMHYPLSDTIIEKMKPFFLSQIYSSELVASFRSLLSNGIQYENAAAQWFHHKVMKKSNFEEELARLIDTMLAYGVGIMKSYFDVKKDQALFESIDPLMLIVPSHTDKLSEADWIVHVKHYSQASYQRQSNFKQDSAFIDSIKGRGGDDSSSWQDVKCNREGITYGTNNDQIVVWEIYERDANDRILVHTISPINPDKPIRPSMKLPYLHCEAPFVEFPLEIKEKGFYSSRGIIERLKNQETYLSKLLSEKSDAMTLYNTPLFYAQGHIPNTSSFEFVPGQIFPFPIQSMNLGSPPISWDRELLTTKEIAEQLIAVPDFGMGGSHNKEKRTATEIANISAIMSQNIGSRARLFKHYIGKLLNLHYKLLLQYKNEDLTYFFRNTMSDMPPEGLHKDYEIEPNISGDNFSKEQLFNKKLQRFQMLANNPYVNQEELTKSLIEADDPQDVKRLLDNPQNIAPQEVGL